MVRILSGLVLLFVVIGGIWFLSPFQLLLLAEVVLVLGFLEYAQLASRLGAPVPKLAAGTAAVATCAAVGWPGLPAEVPMMAALVAFAAIAIGSDSPGARVLHRISASLFPAVWLGLPLGALVALRWLAGREVVLLLLVTTVASDTAQYYSGSFFGRRRLAPVISPGKTIEGAAGGFAGGIAALVIGGAWWLPSVGALPLAALGAVVAALGILGDLFESLLKRSAEIKDTSGLIPGHGGVLDRIDSLLFAVPAYYLFVRYLA
jgi:phosphatidate cytidylyltransferase